LDQGLKYIGGRPSLQRANLLIERKEALWIDPVADEEGRSCADFAVTRKLCVVLAEGIEHDV
jgi:hypothetical protein